MTINDFKVEFLEKCQKLVKQNRFLAPKYVQICNFDKFLEDLQSMKENNEKIYEDYGDVVEGAKYSIELLKATEQSNQIMKIHTKLPQVACTQILAEKVEKHRQYLLTNCLDVPSTKIANFGELRKLFLEHCHQYDRKDVLNIQNEIKEISKENI